MVFVGWPKLLCSWLVASSQLKEKGTSSPRIRSVSSPSFGYPLGTSVSPTRLSANVRSLDTVSEQQDSFEGATKRSANARQLVAKALVNPNVTSPSKWLEQNHDFLAMEQRDRSFTKLLLMVTERRFGQIEKVLDLSINDYKGVNARRKDDRLINVCLRMGVAQLLFTSVQPYAAVKETIDILRKIPQVRVSEAKIKFANAVLRQIAKKGPQLLEETSLNDNVSPWLTEEWTKSWGKERTQEIIDSLVKEPEIHLSVNFPLGSTETERQQLLNKVSQSLKGEVLPIGSIRVPPIWKGPLANWPLYEEGLWWVQDVSAALPGLALFHALKEENLEDTTVIDMCAAPGGKTMQLASLGFGKVMAIDVNSARIVQLDKNLERTGLASRCTVGVADGTTWVPEEGNPKAKGVLLDVPCTSTGTGRKNPDVLRRSQEDVDTLLDLQEKLATHCADNILEPGGIMVYATCSLQRSEGEDQIRKLLDRTEGSKLKTLPINPQEVPGFEESIDENGWLRVFPGAPRARNLKPCSGFFVARLQKLGDT